MAQSTGGKAESIPEAKTALSDAAASAQAGMRDQFVSTREALADSGQRMAQQAKDMVRSAAEEQKMRAVHGLHGMARSMHEMARSLHDEQQDAPARYVDMAAEQIERGIRALEERGVDELMSDVETFARRQPALFIGGAFAAGFLIARFLKSTDRSTEAQTGYAGAGYGTSAYPATPMAGGTTYGEEPPYGSAATPQTQGGGI
jgi:hypothetical protein